MEITIVEAKKLMVDLFNDVCIEIGITHEILRMDVDCIHCSMISNVFPRRKPKIVMQMELMKYETRDKVTVRYEASPEFLVHIAPDNGTWRKEVNSIIRSFSKVMKGEIHGEIELKGEV